VQYNRTFYLASILAFYLAYVRTFYLGFSLVPNVEPTLAFFLASILTFSPACIQAQACSTASTAPDSIQAQATS
jgi:hypothetical protein